jgi:anti-sigma factor RsiW
MSDESYSEFLEASWRRKLTAEEQEQLRAWLAAHPEAQADWEEEGLVTQQLERLPNAPMSSNFTAQVMQKLDLELAREEREQRRRPRATWWRLAPRYAGAMLIALLAGLGVLRYREHQVDEMVESVTKVTPVASVLEPEILKDFDAIQQLQRVPVVSDAELLAALQ